MLFGRLPLLLLMVGGVVSALTASLQGNTVVLRPTITAAQQVRICADLCRSGLGGAPCGDVCYDLLPKEIPVQSPNENVSGGDGDGAGGEAGVSAGAAAVTITTGGSVTRNEACPVLCTNRLGYPFCQCEQQQQHTTSNTSTSSSSEQFTVDFNEICAHYCLRESWVLRGCPPCRNRLAQQEHFPSLFRQDVSTHLARLVQIPGIAVQRDSRVDWGKWCNIQCANSNGGSACNCDILPFSLKFN